MRMEMDRQGYDVLWYLCVFLAAAYIRRFGVPFLDRKRNAILLYLTGCALIFAGTFALRGIYLHTGRFETMIKMFLEYNHICNFIASVGLFAFFTRVNLPDKIGSFIRRIAPYSLGVYLLHENMGIRYTWPSWFHTEQTAGVAQLLGIALTAVVIVFVIGVLVDYIRNLIMNGLHCLLLQIGLYQKLIERIEYVDQLFSAKKKL